MAKKLFSLNSVIIILLVIAGYFMVNLYQQNQNFSTKIAQLDKDNSSINRYELLSRKAVLENLYTNNIHNLTLRLKFAKAAIEHNRDIQSGINQLYLAQLQIEQFKALGADNRVVNTLETTLKMSQQLQSSIFDRLLIIEQMIANAKLPKIEVEASEMNNSWYQWLRSFIVIESINSKDTALTGISLRIYVGLLEQLRYDLINGHFDHYDQTIKRLNESGYIRQQDEKLFIMLKSALPIVNLEALQDLIDKLSEEKFLDQLKPNLKKEIESQEQSHSDHHHDDESGQEKPKKPMQMDARANNMVIV